MKLFGKSPAGRKTEEPRFDPARLRPAIRRSICSGERVAGFIDAGGRFTEVALIDSDRALEDFRRQYGITGEIETIY